jgi:hypothetical protein
MIRAPLMTNRLIIGPRHAVNELFAAAVCNLATRQASAMLAALYSCQ